MLRIKNKYNSGQALLIVLLSMAVILTVVLSILARSITDISISSQDEDSLRAFSAAEAGVEKALIIGADIGQTSIGSASYTANVSQFAEGEKQFVNPVANVSGESTTIWFVAHDENNDFSCTAEKPCFTGRRIKFCWGKEDTPSDSETTPAVEISIFYLNTIGDYSSTRIARAAIDPNSSRRSTNKFSTTDSGTCTIEGETFKFQITLDLSPLGVPPASYQNQNGLQFARVRFFYNTDASYKVGVDVNFVGNTALPAQGLKIDSSGSSGTANRKVDVFQSYPEIPEIFASAIYSLGGIIK